MSHSARTLKAIDYFLADLEGDALDCFNELEPPSSKPLSPHLDVFDRASEACRQADRLALWEAELAQTWLHMACWVASYSYTLISLRAGDDAEARRDAFRSPMIQSEMRREVRRLTESVMF